MLVEVISNNPAVPLELGSILACSFREESLLDLLTRVRDRVHQGERLLSHPLSGSIKPGETPYKSVIMDCQRSGNIDPQSLQLIEDALQISRRMVASSRYDHSTFPAKVLADFSLVDLCLLRSALESLGVNLH